MSSIFKDWLKRHNFKAKQFAEATGMNPNTLTSFSNDPNWDDKRTRLAMSALAAGLEPWSADNAHEADAVKPVLQAVRQATGVQNDR